MLLRSLRLLPPALLRACCCSPSVAAPVLASLAALRRLPVSAPLLRPVRLFRGGLVALLPCRFARAWSAARSLASALPPPVVPVLAWSLSSASSRPALSRLVLGPPAVLVRGLPPALLLCAACRLLLYRLARSPVWLLRPCRRCPVGVRGRRFLPALCLAGSDGFPLFSGGCSYAKN
jgi:hypothetical protein